MGDPKYSVIIPTYNVAPYIAECLQSALGQSFQNIELIVVDDGSTDETVQVIQDFSDDRIRLIVNPSNRGVSHSRNVGISEARGEYVVLLDSDDVLVPTRIATLDEYLSEGPCDLIFDDLLYFTDGQDPSDSNVTAYSKRGISDPAELGYAEFLEKDLAILKGVIRKSFLDKHSIRYPEGHNVGEDFAFYSDVFLHGARARFVAGPMYLYRLRQASLATSVSDAYYASLLATTSLVLERHRKVLAGNPQHKALLHGRLAHQAAVRNYHLTTSKLKSRDFAGALSHLVRDPRVGISMGKQALKKLKSVAAR